MKQAMPNIVSECVAGVGVGFGGGVWRFGGGVWSGGDNKT